MLQYQVLTKKIIKETTIKTLYAFAFTTIFCTLQAQEPPIAKAIHIITAPHSGAEYIEIKGSDNTTLEAAISALKHDSRNASEEVVQYVSSLLIQMALQDTLSEQKNADTANDQKEMPTPVLSQDNKPSLKRWWLLAEDRLAHRATKKRLQEQRTYHS